MNGDVNVVLFCYARLFFLFGLFAGTVLLNGTVDDCMSCYLLYGFRLPMIFYVFFLLLVST